MQWIGALLFIGTTTLIGFNISSQLTERPKHIRQMKNALQILEAEILYSQLPLPDVFAKLAKQVPRPVNMFFAELDNSLKKENVDLYSQWTKCVDRLLDISALGASEGEIMKQFGRTLGQHDFTQQQKHIHLAIKHLDRELEEAQDEHYKYSTMVKSLGVLCGIFIVLLLI